MTIQISLVIWTVIGFVTLSMILNKFLFKPLLNLMDARNEKIQKGEAERQAAIEREEKIRKARELSNQARTQEALKSTERELAKGFQLCRLKFTLSPSSHQRRQWHPTPVLLPGKSHGRRSLVGCSPWGR